MTSKFHYLYTDPATFNTGNTPFGIYDDDLEFQKDAPLVCKWVARRVGYPVMDVEMNNGSIYACFEESVSEYSTIINNAKARDWMWDHIGQTSTSSDLNNTVPNPQLGVTVILSDGYGQANEVGGTVDYYSGSITLVEDQQDYDLQEIYSSSLARTGEGNKRIEIRRVYNPAPAAITRFYDPYAGSFDQRSILDSFGMGNTSPAVTFVLRPISYDITRANIIETSNIVRKSVYSFEIVNNKVKIFPIPTSNDAGEKIWFDYYIEDEKKSPINTTNSGTVTDMSNIPYTFLTYSDINDAGKQWIRKYTLALSKITLGYIRGKFDNIPLTDGGDMQIMSEELISSGEGDKDKLMEQLSELLEQASVTEKVKREAEEAEAVNAVLSKQPPPIQIFWK